MNESSQKDTKTYLDFEVVSPIHIGTKDGNLSALEFVFHECRTYVIDENKFAELLKNKKLIDEFIEKVREGKLDLKKDFLKTQEFETVSRYSVPGGSNQMKNFRPFVRDGNGDIFLPGSSIKGVFRTALIYGILSNDEQKRKNIEKTIDRTLNNKNNRLSERDKKKFSTDFLHFEKGLLQNFELPHAEKEQHKDILRCLTVRDAYPVDKIECKIINIQFLSKSKDADFYWSCKKKNGQKTDKLLDIWLEAVTNGKFRFELIWDKKLFQKFQDENKNVKMPISGIDDLKKFVFQMSNDIFEHEERFYSSEEGKAKDAAKALKQWYENKKGKLMRIGFGSGMLSTTVNSNFKDEDDNGLTIMQRIRNICYNRKNDTSTAPKSRRIWKKSDSEWQPMGWLKIDSNDIVKKTKPATAEPERKAAQVSMPKYSQPKPSAVKMEAPKPVQVRKQEIVEEKPSTSQILFQINHQIRHDDKIQMERIVQEIEELEDENDQREAATALMEKLKAAGKNESVWKKHPLRKKIEFILGIQV